MQTYKNYKQCTTISTDKIKYLSARYSYFPMPLEFLTYPESKTKLPILSLLKFSFPNYDLN